MGAQLWYHETPWHKNANVALNSLQARYFAENYDLPALLPQHLTWARDSVVVAENENDTYGLLEMYQDHLEQLEQICRQPIPDDIEAQIDILRVIWSISGEGIGNVLDLTGISPNREPLFAQLLNEREIVRLVGTNRPTRVDAQNSVDKINEELGRGECVCFPFYEGDEQSGWSFVGNTLD